VCDVGHAHAHEPFGFLVDTPEIRSLIEETRRLVAAIPDHAGASKRCCSDPARAQLEVAKRQELGPGEC
jgi:hypothetical protein